MGDQTSELKELERVFVDDSAEPIKISYAAIEQITNNFAQKIGDGGFAVVYLGHLQNGKVAVKKLNRSYNYSDEQFSDEIACLLKVKHKNIVRFLGYCADTQNHLMEVGGKLRIVEDQRRLLCFEYVPNGSLHHFIKEKFHGFGWNMRYQIIKGICQGLNYLHDQRIYHLDLKPANVLLDAQMEPKITDFGLSRLISDQSTMVTETFFGTIGYIAPEFIAKQQISSKSDIFSLGVIMINVLIGCTGSIIDNWHEETLGISCPNMKICIEIAQICVDTNPRNRPTIAEIIHKLNAKETMTETVRPRINEPRNDRGSSLGQAVQTFHAPSAQTLREYSRMEGEIDIVVNSSSKPCGPLEDYFIPDYVLKPDAEQVLVDHAPHCPVLVFINSRSSGQLGSSLIKTYGELLNEAQVFDISEEAPDKALHRFYGNLERLKTEGDILAFQIWRTLRLIVAGDDGTASWLLGVVSDLKLSHPPPIATVPLGTGNNLPFSIGWGKKNGHADQDTVKSILGLVKHAREIKIDSWHILLRMRAPKDGPCDPMAPLELPHLLHAFHRVSSSDSLNMEGYHTFRGGFWNYFSMGIDAEVSYSERKNQLIYPGKVGRKKGWLFASRSRPSSRNIAQLAKVKIMKRPGGQWEDLHVHHNIHSIVCLNLPSFSGGLNPWGTPGTRTVADRDLTESYVDDGLIEVVGFRDAWHGLVLLAPNGHGTRLAQVHRIRFEFHKGAADHTFMRMDGEPWKQPLPKDDDTVVVEISHLGQVTMLANEPCRSKSVNDPASPWQVHGSHGSDEDEYSMEDEDEWEDGKRKFGAAGTFKIPDEIDISPLS